ncbi:MAG: hypothetical protein H6739_16770 [Alphaproteobacteria bacterium]|nr:hypothetical protein [Alphaproteobacteria bacterium]
MRAALPLLLLGMACKDDPEPTETASDSTPTVDSVSDSTPEPTSFLVDVHITLDGEPVEGVVVAQGGAPERWLTDAGGDVRITFDNTVEGDAVVVASHPEARILGAFVTVPEGDAVSLVVLDLERYAAGDNLLYTFQDPGEPDIVDSTNQCSHCHVTLVDAWFGSPHRSSASNPRVQDLYAGVAAAWADAAACAAAGGQWLEGLAPGTRAPAERCYLGAGVLPDLNPDCAEDPCDGQATAFGACADCHAPGIDGALGGRDLLEAEGFAYEDGVHCDVCHKVESIDLSAEAGVAGRLHLTRPSEELTGPLGPWEPLTFGPYDDVVNPRMGSVQRDHFREATFCAGCHELDQPALVPGVALDADRWPDGRLPVHSTYSEWAAGPMNPGVVCQSCHMPADADVGNAADLENEFEGVIIGIAAGWYRTPGAVRQHSWVGPRQPESRMLQLAATVDIEAERVDDAWEARVRVENAGPGHAIPTGEPLRSLLLTVTATCDGAPLDPVGGDVVPDYGGAVAERAGDLSVWPEAQVGDRIRVAARGEGFVDYDGVGPFATDGRFDADEKGIPVLSYVGEAEVIGVSEGGAVTTSPALPSGDVAWLVRDTRMLAGAPGWGFARVMVDADGARMAPHHRAVDVASDNRLKPRTAWTSTHRFDGGCEAPVFEATLLHRPLPLALAAERGWEAEDAVMVEARR